MVHNNIILFGRGFEAYTDDMALAELSTGFLNCF